MKRALAFVVVLAIVAPASAADPRAERHALILELLQAVDARDGEEVYGQLVDETFSNPELAQLIAFFKTNAGQKVVAMFPSLVRSALRPCVDVVAPPAKREPWELTMADLRTVATAAEAYATDTNRYPEASTYEALPAVLSPTYIKTVPGKDGWGTPFVYVVSSDGQHYRFVSAGADQRFEAGSDRIDSLPENFKPRAMESLDADIIFQDGTFIQFPAASKQEMAAP